MNNINCTWKLKQDSTSEDGGKKASRRALAACLQKPPGDFGIVDHLFLQEHPEKAVSLSHTDRWGAALIASRREYISVGIDIELTDRPVNPGTHKFFINPEDKSDLSPLQAWVAKEACFKAFYPLRPDKSGAKTYVLNSLWLSAQYFGLRGNRYPLGQYHLFKDSGLVISIAWLL